MSCISPEETLRSSVQWCRCTLGTCTHVARHIHGARGLEEGAPVVFVTSLQRPLPVPGGGQAARQEGSEGGPLALAGGSSHYIWGGLGTSRATVWPECLVQLGCGPCLRPVCGQGWAR